MSADSRGDAAPVQIAHEPSAVLFTRHWSARAPLARVALATGLSLTPALHPLITRVESLSEHGNESECVLHELVPLGPLRIPNKYRATRSLSRTPDGGAQLVLEAFARLGVQLRHELTLREVGERTEVVHVVRVRAPRLVRGFVASTAQRAHDAWVERVVAWAERER